jgi:hypothetical protein
MDKNVKEHGTTPQAGDSPRQEPWCKFLLIIPKPVSAEVEHKYLGGIFPCSHMASIEEVVKQLVPDSQFTSYELGSLERIK